MGCIKTGLSRLEFSPRKVYRGRSEPFESLDVLAEAAKQAWKEILLDDVRKSIDQFRPRLKTGAQQNGGPILHL